MAGPVIDVLPVDACSTSARRKLDERPDQQRNQDRRADDQRHEDRAPRPEHLAERQVEDRARLDAGSRAPAGCGRRVGGFGLSRGRHYFTRYWKTAWRLSSGDVTSSIAPNSPLAASSVSRA